MPDEINMIEFMRETNQGLRDEIEMLRKQVQRLEESRDTWKALTEAYRILAESQTNGNA
jgi:cell division septum initiation protein DivIVA